MAESKLSWPGTGTALVSIAVGLVTTLAVAAYFNKPTNKATADAAEPTSDDHAVLRHYSTSRPFKTPFAKYDSLRVFYRPHAHHEKLDAIADLPLLVFIHGLGGSLDQFAPLLSSLVNVAPCFGIELPGHGLSQFAPEDYDAYTTSAIKVLWRSAIQQVCSENHHKNIVLIGHSYGCSIAALLATDPKFQAVAHIGGIVAICPKAAPPSYSEVIKYKAFLSLPDSWLDLFRWWDRRGGVDSKSVKRFVGEGAGIDQRNLQLRYNEAFKTPVWKRIAMGALPEYDAMSRPIGGLPGRDTWAKVRVPLLLIAGEGDKVTKPSELAEIVSFMQKPGKTLPGKTQSEPVPVANSTQAALPISTQSNKEASTGVLPDITTTKTSSSSVVKAATLAAPAAHALLYDHRTYRTVSGLIGDFLSSQVSEHLSLGWQVSFRTLPEPPTRKLPNKSRYPS
jgi:pimeloyl-ACP methyl ester carboxylesterase